MPIRSCSMRWWAGPVLALTAALALALWLRPGRSVPEVSGPLFHDAYLWQRAWTAGVRKAVRTRAPAFRRLVVLAAQVRFIRGRPHVHEVAVPYAELARAGAPIGLAVRIGSYGGPFAAKDATTAALTDLIGTLVQKARAHALPLAEVQLDFDCAETKLAGFRVWVETLARRVAPVPLTLTALPAWLDRRAFAPLARASGGFVLQVHSLSRPRRDDPAPTLCDVRAARRAVERAARCGVPFRVALPTYGYVVGFDASGRYLGVAAEGSSPRWPAGAELREVRARPDELAALVRDWQRVRPSAMTGLIWYRLPVPGDRLNWRWATLKQVMQGRVPRAALRVALREPSPGLFELALVNTGAGAPAGPIGVRLDFPEGRLVACDGLAGFDIAEVRPHGLSFRSAVAPDIPPGERRPVGWVRLSQTQEVTVALDR